MKTVTTYQIIDASKNCGVDSNVILQFIKQEWITPFDKALMQFDEEDIERIKLIAELQDLGVNDDAVPIILHLIDQLNLYHQGLRH